MHRSLSFFVPAAPTLLIYPFLVLPHSRQDLHHAAVALLLVTSLTPTSHPLTATARSDTIVCSGRDDDVDIIAQRHQHLPLPSVPCHPPPYFLHLLLCSPPLSRTPVISNQQEAAALSHAAAPTASILARISNNTYCTAHPVQHREELIV